MEREWTVEESIVIRARADAVYAAVSNPKRMTAWSPELFAVLRRRGGRRFVGFNRRGPYVWFTRCTVTAAVPGRAYAFRVASFGMPVAVWGYRIEDIGDGVRLAEYWEDLRRDNRGAALVSLLGRVFTGVRADRRADLNRAGMRTTLERLRDTLEAER